MKDTRYYFYTLGSSGKYYFFNSFSSRSYGLKVIKEKLNRSNLDRVSLKINYCDYAFGDPRKVEYMEIFKNE